MNEIVEFLLDNNARISNGDKWMVVCKVGEDVFYTVRQQSYGKRKATTLYDGIYLATALRYLGEES